MAEQESFRLHVGGLGPSVVSEDLQRRFAAFGTVVKVDGVGKLDANGFPLKYAFVDIISTATQIKRCMNLLSGTTYKGSTLRIAPARPDYAARIEREKANLPINTCVDPDEEAIQISEEKAAQKLERKLAKIRARKRGIEGYESSNMELMTVKKFKSRIGTHGWKKDAETSLPIFPILTRPLRPLPPLESTPPPDDNTNEPSTCHRVPSRARRIRIDPTGRELFRSNSINWVSLAVLKISRKAKQLDFCGNANPAKTAALSGKLTNGDDLAQEERVQLSDFTLRKLQDADDCHSSNPIPSPPTEHCNTSPAQPTERRNTSPTHQRETVTATVPPPSTSHERDRHLNILRLLRQAPTANAMEDTESD
ncbi:hypothetical protein PSHT_10762 [Puccinia striiformis]|uniref:RRM domain-containing protein n=1 Tax=Puccinia striiformis TaxID=27350 RepID=A0A2S4V7D8_9BASI|nr:hypothetical protein PSHT_10762 [Puccinia striiformis]